jgi:hypothetical protein
MKKNILLKKGLIKNAVVISKTQYNIIISLTDYPELTNMILIKKGLKASGYNIRVNEVIVVKLLDFDLLSRKVI